MKSLSNLTPSMSILLTAAAMLAVYVVVGFNLIDSAAADRIITFLLGGGAGAALVGGQMKGGTA